MWPEIWKLRSDARGKQLDKVSRELGRAKADLIVADAAVERLTQERDRANAALAREQVRHSSILASQQRIAQVNRNEDAKTIRTLREQVERQADRLEELHGENERLKRERAELEATVAGLGEQLRDQEKRLEDKQFMAEDHAYGRRMDGEADHL